MPRPFPGAPGTIGVITPMSHNYCERCNRMSEALHGRLRLGYVDDPAGGSEIDVEAAAGPGEQPVPFLGLASDQVAGGIQLVLGPGDAVVNPVAPGTPVPLANAPSRAKASCAICRTRTCSRESLVGRRKS